VVVGGGTAGWMSALMAQRFLPEAQVTLVEDPATPLIGVGEGTTPQFIHSFLDPVGIPVSRLVREAGATIKNCFRHTDWNGDGASYHHPFGDGVTPRPELTALHPDATWHDGAFSFAARACERGRVVLERGANAPPTPAHDPMQSLRLHGAFAVHFDAARLAELLARVGAERGVRRVLARVVTFNRGPTGDLEHLFLDDGQVLDADFVFDCTGLSRAIIGGLHGTPWRDESAVLPCDRALPFNLPTSEPLPPFSESRAMRHGWLWTIPVQGRLGCGYVFDSRMAASDTCLAELQDRFGGALQPRPTLDFRPGWFTRPWVQNCVAVGLSSGFLEPLEATSIWFAVASLNELFRRDLPLGDEAAREAFNGWFQTLMERGRDFIYLHYLGRRRDTPFWQTFRERTQVPESVKAALSPDGWRNWVGDDANRAGNPLPFGWASWWHVAGGTHNLDRSVVSRYWDYYGLHADWQARQAAERGRINDVVDRCLTHEDCLLWLGAPDPAR
jgi:hypothetical protein